MHIGLVELEIRFPESHSLKEKRAPLRSFMDRARRNHNVSVAEVAYQDEWQRSGVAAVGVNTDRSHLERTLASVEKEIADTAGVEITGARITWL
jgi:hypothetical protein